MKLRRIYLVYALTLAVIQPVWCACSSNDDPDPIENNVSGPGQFTLPAKINLVSGSELTFAVDKGEVPTLSDYLVLEATDGTKSMSSVTAVTETTFTVRFNKSVTDGTYRVYLKHGDRNIPLGNITITLVEDYVEPAEGATLYGMVKTTDGKGVAGVVVSDGKEVTVTDADGVYNIESNKDYGYVFISVPSGYEIETDGVLPRIYRITSAARQTPERFDFKLTKIDNQANYKLLVFGDMHLANRNTGDLKQWKEFTADVRNYLAANSGSKIYALTLGDMTWDIYWYSNTYYLSNYLKDVNEQLDGLTIFHTMGNHDNDMKTYSDFDAEAAYRRTIAPPYYSFNIGKVHYVVLDDINCSKYDGSNDRNYYKIVTDAELDWLAKDLSYIDPSTPLVVTAHAPFFRPADAKNFRYDDYEGRVANTNALLDLIKGHNAQLVTGHTHNNYNILPADMPIKGYDVTEHNVAAICASWWWTSHLTPGYHVACDGTPGGYAIWDINGNDMQWIYKGTGKNEDYQFRTYDLNNVSFSLSDVPNMTGASATVTRDFNYYVKAYPENNNNEVLINIWNWNSAWTLTVTTEEGAELTATPVMTYDPLHIAVMSLPRFNTPNLSSTPNFVTELWPHFFKVKCPNATTDLKITVKDEFGHVWTEDMARPKPFDIKAYK